MQRIAVSAEAYGAFNKKEAYVPKVIHKSEEQVQRIKARILQSFLFNSLDQGDLNIVINAMEEKVSEYIYILINREGDTVIQQGDIGDCLYFVESGDLDCFKKFVIYNY
jgi:cAMP-dependent protein kinase regulator